jgi:hypothetical protein
LPEDGKISPLALFKVNLLDISTPSSSILLLAQKDREILRLTLELEKHEPIEAHNIQHRIIYTLNES